MSLAEEREGENYDKTKKGRNGKEEERGRESEGKD